MIWYRLFFFRNIFIISFMILTSISALAGIQEQYQDEPIEVIAAFPKNFPPQCFLDENGEPTGFAIDVMNQVAKLAKLKVVYRPEENFVEAANSLKNGKADLIPNSGITTKRMLDSDFTVPVETFEIVIFVRETTHDITSLNDLKGRKVAVLPLNVGRRIANGQKDITIVLYNEISTAIFDLIAGKVDGFIYPKPVVLKMARDAGIDQHIKVAGKPLVEIKRAIRVLKGSKLLARLNPAVEEFLVSAEYQSIYTKWYGEPRPYWTIVKVVMVMSSFFLIIFIALIIWRYKSLSSVNMRLTQEVDIRKQTEEELYHSYTGLEKQIEDRTKELAESNKELLSEMFERKRVEKQLSKSNERLKRAQAVGNVGHWEYDPVNDIIYGSDEYYRIFGSTPEKHKEYNDFISSVHPEDVDHVRTKVDAALNKKEPYIADYRIVLPDSSIKYIHVQTEMEYDDNDRPIHMFGSLIDVTELKIALDEVKTLQGLIPICSHCKKIRDDKGYWNILELYIQKHSDASFSHGMCPECSDDLYGNEDWYIEMKNKKEIE